MLESAYLRKISVVLKEHGWMRGPSTLDGKLCIMAATNVADPGRKQWWKTLDELKRDLGVRFLHIWNDAPDRTEADIHAALERTAARLEAAGR